MLTYATTLIKKTKLNNSTYLFCFNLPEGQKLDFTPGQYVMMVVGEKTRLYSIASSNKITSSFELLIELLDGGLGSEYLRGLNHGSQVLFRGPAGLYKIHDFSKPLVFIATGTGYAPMRSILLSYLNEFQQPVRLFWGMKYKQDLYLLNELDELKQKAHDFSYTICLSREEVVDTEQKPPCHKGHVTDYLNNLTDDMKKDAHFYICGGRRMVEDVNTRLLSIGVEKERIIFEKY